MTQHQPAENTMEPTMSGGEPATLAGAGTGAPLEPATERAPHLAATAAVLAATLLGIAGDALLRTAAAGISLVLWVVAALAATVWVARTRGRRLTRAAAMLVVPVVFFAAVFAWRAAGGLLALNMLAMLSAFGALALALSGWPRRLTAASPGEMILGAASVAFSGMFGAPALIISDRALADGGARPRWRSAAAIARGVLIALPVLLVFGALLSSADARFERLIRSLIDIDFEETIAHLVFAAFVAWVAAGYLRAAAVAERPLGLSREWHMPRVTLGIVELATVLALIDVLFALFVAIQLPHLFGGMARVQEVAGLTVAEYARGGFFQLVVVAALVLPVLIAGAALASGADARSWRMFRALSLGMIVLVAVMIASALQRLALYIASFGLTEDRVYATAIIAWLAIVFVVLVATVLRRRDAGFAFATLVSGWVVLAALDVVNPQALVVRVNADRAAHGAAFDWAYASHVSFDGTPELVKAMPLLDAPSRCSVAKTLAMVASGRELPDDWRGWNAARARAFVVANEAKPTRVLASCPRTAISP